MKTTITRQIVSHLFVAFIAFQFGLLMAATSSSSSSSSCIQPYEDIISLLHARSMPTLLKNTTTTISTRIIDKESIDDEFDLTKDFIHGVSWVPREDFARNLVLGFPLETTKKQRHGGGGALILYTTKESRPSNYSLNDDLFKTINDVDTAVQNCDDLNVIVTDRRRPRSCIAIYENWGSSKHVHRFFRNPPKTGRLQYGSKYSSPEGVRGVINWNSPPSQATYRESFKKLAKYFDRYFDALVELRPIAKTVSKAGRNRAIIVMVVNFGQSHLLFNYVCSARKIGMDLNKVLLFALDEKTNDIAKSLGLHTYYNESIFQDMPSSTKSNAHPGYSKVMVAKVYCVQMINDLGYDCKLFLID